MQSLICTIIWWTVHVTRRQQNQPGREATLEDDLSVFGINTGKCPILASSHISTEGKGQIHPADFFSLKFFSLTVCWRLIEAKQLYLNYLYENRINKSSDRAKFLRLISCSQMWAIARFAGGRNEAKKNQIKYKHTPKKSSIFTVPGSWNGCAF